jgi:hypothetical protein
MARYTADDVYVGATVYPAGTSEAELQAAVDATLPKGEKADLEHIEWTAQPPAASVDPDGPPPKSGRGSGVKAWADYAKASDVDVDEAATKEQIIAALDAAGVPTE